MKHEQQSRIGFHVQALHNSASISEHYAGAPEVRMTLIAILSECFGWTLANRIGIPEHVPNAELALAYADSAGAPGILVCAAPMGKLEFNEAALRAGRAAKFETIALSDGIAWIISRPRDGVMLRVDDLHSCAGAGLALPLLAGAAVVSQAPAADAEDVDEAAAPTMSTTGGAQDGAVAVSEGSDAGTADGCAVEVIQPLPNGMSQQEYLDTLAGQVGRTFRQKVADRPQFTFEVEVEARRRFVLKAGSEITDRPLSMDRSGPNKSVVDTWETAVKEGEAQNALSRGQGVTCKVLQKDVVFDGATSIMLAVYGSRRAAPEELVDVQSDPKEPVLFRGIREIRRRAGLKPRPRRNAEKIRRSSPRTVLPKIEAPILLRGPNSRNDSMVFRIRWETNGEFTLLAGSEIVSEIPSGERAPFNRDLLVAKHRDLVERGSAVDEGLTRRGKSVLSTRRDITFPSIATFLPGLLGFSPSTPGYIKCDATGETFKELVDRLSAQAPEAA